MSSYQNTKNYFSDLLNQYHWKLSEEIITKSLNLCIEEGSVRQRALQFQAKLLKTNGTVWEALQIGKRFFAVISIENCWQILSEDGSILIERHVGAPISYARIFFLNKSFHVFVAEGGHITYSSFSATFNIEFPTYRYTYEGTLNDSVLEVLPIYSNDSRTQRIDFLWAVYHSKIVFLSISSTESSIKSVIHYSVPPKARLLNAQVKFTCIFENHCWLY